MSHRVTKPLKIAHIIQTLSAKFGGPATVLQMMAKEQSLAGHEVTILTTNLDYPKKILTSKSNGLVNGSLAEIKYFSSEIPFIYFSRSLAVSLRRKIQQIDVLHVWCLYRFPQTYSCFVARRRGVPYIIRPCGALEPFLFRQSAVNLPLKRIYEWCFEWPNLRKASAVNCVTEKEAENLPKFIPREKVFVLGNGIDWAVYRNLPERYFLRRRLNLGIEVPLVLFLGRINFKKGLDLLVPGFDLVLKKIPKARLAIVGPDNEGYGLKVRKWCQDQGIADKVLFVDYLRPEEVKQAYVDADVFVLPSYTENFGMTVVEAMACGCPVVISGQVNIWKEVNQAGAGIVVNLDAEEISKAICLILEDKRIADKMGKKGRLFAKERYAWPKIIDKLTQIYCKLIDESSNRR